MAEKKPNIVLILADNLYLSSKYPTQKIASDPINTILKSLSKNKLKKKFIIIKVNNKRAIEYEAVLGVGVL